jgi:hypothetical protein
VSWTVERYCCRFYVQRNDILREHETSWLLLLLRQVDRTRAVRFARARSAELCHPQTVVCFLSSISLRVSRRRRRGNDQQATSFRRLCTTSVARHENRPLGLRDSRWVVEFCRLSPRIHQRRDLIHKLFDTHRDVNCRDDGKCVIMQLNRHSSVCTINDILFRSVRLTHDCCCF